MISTLMVKDSWESYKKFYDRIVTITNKVAPIHAKCHPDEIYHVSVDKWYPIFNPDRICIWFNVDFKDPESHILTSQRTTIDEDWLWKDDWMEEYEIQFKKLEIGSLDYEIKSMQKSIQSHSNYLEQTQKDLLEKMEERNKLIEELSSKGLLS